jgi:hypothetical protein
VAFYDAVSGGARVKLPPYVGEPVEVFVNGVPQERGRDYERIGAELVFTRELAQEGRLGFWRWTSIFFGVAGTYRKHETVDVVYQHGAERLVATGLPVTPG